MDCVHDNFWGILYGCQGKGNLEKQAVKMGFIGRSYF